MMITTTVNLLVIIIAATHRPRGAGVPSNRDLVKPRALLQEKRSLSWSLYVTIYMQKSWPKTLGSYGLKLQPDASSKKFKRSATIPVHSDHRHVLISEGVDFPLIREKSPESGLFLISLRTGPPSSQRFRHNPTLIHGKEKKKTKTKTEPMM